MSLKSFLSEQTNVIGIEDKILALYAKGLSTRDISKALEEIYGFEASHETISNVTDKIIPLIQDWQKRPLEAVYPIIYLDALHVKVKDKSQKSIMKSCLL